MIYEDGRVYLSQFHYKKHKKYLDYISTIKEQEEKNHNKK